jgi:hypothetical protein
VIDSSLTEFNCPNPCPYMENENGIRYLYVVLFSYQLQHQAHSADWIQWAPDEGFPPGLIRIRHVVFLSLL